MVALDAVVGVLLSGMERVGDEFFDDSLERLGEIADHLIWFPVSVERTLEERFRSVDVASG